MLSKAIQIAQESLAGKTDDRGNPYVDHAMRVMAKMDTEEEKIAAVLHDVVEDTEVTLGDLKKQGFSRAVLEAVETLTKRKDMTYFEYIDDISCSPLAAKVKIAEIEDNMDMPRVRQMSFQTYSPEARAKKAIAILKGEEESIESN